MAIHDRAYARAKTWAKATRNIILIKTVRQAAGRFGMIIFINTRIMQSIAVVQCVARKLITKIVEAAAVICLLKIGLFLINANLMKWKDN